MATRGRFLLGVIAVGAVILTDPVSIPSAEHRHLRTRLEAFADTHSFANALSMLDATVASPPLFSGLGNIGGGGWGREPPLIELWFHIADASGDCLVLSWTPTGHHVDSNPGCRGEPRLL